MSKDPEQRPSDDAETAERNARLRETKRLDEDTDSSTGTSGKSDAQKTVSDSERTIDPNATRIDATISELNESGATSDDSVPPISGGRHGDEKTVAPDATIDINATIPTDEDPGGNEDLGVSLNEAAGRTVSTDQTIDASFATAVGGDDPVAGGGDRTVLSDSDIGQTINPRDLSDADKDFWSEVASSFAGSFQLDQPQPTTHRSLSESTLKLRHREITTPDHAKTQSADYQIVRLLGKGGMGNVFVARQGSLDRLIALKVIKPLDRDRRETLATRGQLDQVETSRRQQFLSEAVMTGDLDHPNIVPIHDLAVAGEDTVFYAMKRVVGTPWSSVIRENSRDENLEILIKVADAIGFAHTRGVIHRDIKPENVMLGDFGIVMVMDWGIAIAKPNFEKLDSITPAAGLGGTPSYMAPEMAIGPLEAVGAKSDVYLLGAVLFEIVTGKAPHQAADVRDCLKAVANNEICEVSPQHRGELLDIALKAMSRDPDDRFPDVPSFQKAVRDYRSHTESIALAARAREDLELARSDGSYRAFSRSEFGFEEAIALWPGNEPAERGLAEARLAHAQAAYDSEDYDLGLSLLDAENPEHVELVERLRAAQLARQQREARFGMLRRTAVALLAVILVGGSAALYVINDARAKARRAHTEAVASAEVAQTQRQIAEENYREAARQRELAQTNARKATEQRIRAEENARVAQLAEANAQYESYVSQIGLAKARIDRNEFDDARRILVELTERWDGESLPWELRWLIAVANQAQDTVQLPSAATQLAVSDSGNSGIARLADGSVLPIRVRAGIKIGSPYRIASDVDVSAVGLANGAKAAALGSVAGEVYVRNLETGSVDLVLRGHRGRITRVLQTQERFVTSSEDRSIRVWDAQNPDAHLKLWHIAPVVDVAAVPHANGLLIAAAVADQSTGRVVLWQVSLGERLSSERLGVFDHHDEPVTSVALTGSGSLAASSDKGGDILVWLPRSVETENTAKVVGDAVSASFDRADAIEQRADASATRVQSDQSIALTASSRTDPLGLSTGAASPPPVPAHSGAVRRVRFSGDSTRLLSCGDDYTTKIWALNALPSIAASPDAKREGGAGISVGVSGMQINLVRIFRGHGGWVYDADFVGANDHVLSVANDKTARFWSEPEIGGPVGIARVVDRESDATEKKSPVHSDEIWSARFDPSGTRIVTASRDHTAKVLSINRSTMQIGRRTDMRDPGQADNSTKSVAGTAVRDGSAPESLEEGSVFRAMSMVVDEQHGRLYVGSADSVVRVWDIARGTELASFQGTGLNDRLAVSGDGQMVVTGSSSEDAQALVWSIDTTGLHPPLLKHRLDGHQASVAAIAISPDSKLVFTGDRRGRGILWDASDGVAIGDPIDALRGFRINAAVFSADGNSIFVAADDQQVTKLDLASRRPVESFQHNGFVTDVAVSSDNRYMATVSESSPDNSHVCEAHLWDLNNGNKKQLIRLQSPASEGGGRRRGRLPSIRFGDQPRRLAIAVQPPGGQASRVSIWSLADDLDEVDLASAFGLPDRIGDITSCAPYFGDRLLTMHGDAAFLWDTVTLAHQQSYRSHGAVTEARFSADGRFVASGSRSLKVWDARSGRSVGKLETPHDGAVRALAFAPDKNQYLIASGGDDEWVRVWRFDPEAGTFQLIREIDQRGSGSVLCLAYAPDGESLLSTTDRGVVTLHLLGSETSLNLFSSPLAGPIPTGRFSADGKWIAVGCADTVARLWNTADVHVAAESSPEPIEFRGHAEPVEDVAVLSGEGQSLRLFTASGDQSARVWDPNPASGARLGRELLELVGHSSGLTAVDITDDGEVLITAGRDGDVVLWSSPASTTEKKSSPQ